MKGFGMCMCVYWMYILYVPVYIYTFHILSNYNMYVYYPCTVVNMNCVHIAISV